MVTGKFNVGVILRWTSIPSHPGGVETLLVALCYRNRNKRQPNGPHCLYADFFTAWWPSLLISTVSIKLSSLPVGNIDVYIWPGDHLALGEPEDGAVVGGILATAVGIRYRTLCPSLPRLPTSLKQRRAIGKFEAGVNVLLYSKKGRNTWYDYIFICQDFKKTWQKLNCKGVSFPLCILHNPYFRTTR